MQTGWGPIFDAVSPQSGKIAGLFTTALGICGVIFVVVTGAIIYNISCFRAKEGAADPPPNHGHKGIEVVWTVIPAGIVLALMIMTVKVMSSTMPGGDPKPDLIITARQWWWDTLYTDTGAHAANEIHVPVGKRLLAELHSGDVIHDFWAPNIGPKMDIIPGHPNQIWVEADRPGRYRGICAEFCGAQHAWMQFWIIAEPEADFEAWQRRQLQPAANTAAVAAGRRIFQAQVCQNCHSIIGISTNATAGPDLTHLGGRTTLAGGVALNTPANLTRWLEDPQALKPGCLMPNFNLTPVQARELAAFLEATP